ncbi:MAG TPA: MBL fold metallo-hydrolase [Thermoanaerobaculia bacterium]|nr:MBL fold metallo-hydrolase [Thermoanaerobaculia bacterium]
MIRALLAPNPGPFTLDGTRSYLLGDRAVLDPGPPMEEHVAAILEHAPGLDTILLTHRHDDHAGAVPMLKDKTGATVIAPEGMTESWIDRRVADGDHVDLDEMRLEVLATPGHTAEHVCYLSETGELFTGDTVLGQGTTAIFPPDGDMGAYFSSLERLLARAPSRIYPGHGPVRHDAVALLDEYLYHRRMREQEVIESLQEGLRTTAAMRERIYPALDDRLVQAAEQQIQAHLDLLMRQGRVRADQGGYALS